MANPFEWVSSFSVEKNVVRQYGKSGIEYLYDGTKNHNKVLFTADGLTFEQALALCNIVQNAINAGSTTIVDALGNSYFGILLSANGNRPRKGIKLYAVQCSMWDPSITAGL